MNTDAIFNTARQQIGDLIEQQFSDAKEAARQDAEQVIQQSKDRLTRWTQLLADGKIDEEEFGILVDSQKEVVEMTALNQVGITPDRARQLAISTLEIVARIAIAAAV